MSIMSVHPSCNSEWKLINHAYLKQEVTNSAYSVESECYGRMVHENNILFGAP